MELSKVFSEVEERMDKVLGRLEDMEMSPEKRNQEYIDRRMKRTLAAGEVKRDDHA